MAKNTIVGKSKRPGSTKATGRDYSSQKTFNKRPDQVAKRVELNREARKRKIYGKRHANGVDLSHTKSGSMVLEKRSTNRARNGRNGKTTKK
jgi:hypothetical protein